MTEIKEELETKFKKKKKQLTLEMRLEPLDVSADLLAIQKFTEG